MLPNNAEHSAKVRIWLEVGPVCVSVAQVGESSLILAGSNASIRLSGSLLGHLIIIVDEEPLEYAIALRRQRDRTIEFEHISEDSRELDCELDAVPF
jgi:hypothetical protein